MITCVITKCFNFKTKTIFRSRQNAVPLAPIQVPLVLAKTYGYSIYYEQFSNSLRFECENVM